jgi:hypothetical protein
MAQVCWSIVPKSNSPAIHCFAVLLLFHITILLSCHFIVSLFYRLATSLACCSGVLSLYCYTVSLFHHLTIVSFFHSPLLSAFVGCPLLFAITKHFCFCWALSAFRHHWESSAFAISGRFCFSQLSGALSGRLSPSPSLGDPPPTVFTERLPLFAITRRLPLSDFFWALSAFRHHQALPLFAVVRCPQWASFAFAITRRPPTYRFSLGALCFSPSLGAFRFRHHWAPSAFAITGRLHFSPLSAPSPSTCAIAGHFCFSVSLGTFHPHQAPSPSLLALTGRLPLFAITGRFRFSPSLSALFHHFPLLLCASHVSL